MAKTTPSPSSATSPATPSCASPPAARPSPPSASPSTAAGRSDQRVGGADVLLRRRRLGPARRERRGVAHQGRPGHRVTAASSSARGRPRTARSASRSRSSPTRSAPACAGPPPRSSAPTAAAATAAAAVRRRRRRQRRRGAPPAGENQPYATTRSRSDGQSRTQPQRKTRDKDTTKKIKKKVSVLVQERVDYVDYKDVNLLQRFMSDRSKIRARRVSGNDAQQQRDVATAIKNAREMALLPYAKRVTTQRSGRARPRRSR